MALFTLTDINFNKGSKPRKGAASSQLVGGSYESNIYRYPEDIGNYDKGHYMVFHINTQEHSQYGFSEVQNDLPSIIQNRKNYGYDNPLTIFGQATSALGQTSIGQKVKEFSSDLFNKIGEGQAPESIKKAWSSATSISGTRTIKRTTDTIALYMPDTLNFTHQQKYSELSLTGIPSALLSAGASAADALKNNSGTSAAAQVMNNISPFLANFAGNKLGDLGKFAFAAGFGVVQNPQLELLYTSPQFRTFRFDFMFYPRSEKEAKEVQKILDRLRFHQAPEVRKESKGFFLIPPSEFDIKFYYNGAENPNIPPISTCVLDSIDVDYAPNGFSAYEVPGQIHASMGETGMPVAIRLSLNFMETEYLTKDHFSEGKLTKQTLEMSDAWSKTGAVNEKGEGIY